MILKIYNQLSKKKEELLDQQIYWYVCGPTVYDYSHLGHARTYLSTDIIRRILINYYHRDVTMIMNITDIDDKIINRAKDTNQDWYQLARTFETEFFKDMDKLNIIRPDIVTRVSDYIAEIIDFIEVLIHKDYAYEVNGSVYFNVKKYINNGATYHFREYHETLDNTHESEKYAKEDFALWKKSNILDGNCHGDSPGWISPWGKGRPGWHIECSVMSISVLQQLNDKGTMTMHSGGIDLAFPHHENEIIQSETYLGYEWAKIFSHIGHLNIQGQKMSKSLKNFIKIKEFKQDPNVLRMMMLMIRYNQPMDYTDDYVDYAKNTLKRINDYLNYLKNYKRSIDYHQKFNHDREIITKIEKHVKKIEMYIDDDLNTPKVVKRLLKLIEIGYITESLYMKEYIEKIIQKWYDIFGFINVNDKINNYQKDYADIILKIREDVRNMAKKYKELYSLSDKIRDVYLKDLNIQDL